MDSSSREVIVMTLQQEAYNVIDQLSDDGIKVFLDMFNKELLKNNFIKI